MAGIIIPTTNAVKIEARPGCVALVYLADRRTTMKLKSGIPFVVRLPDEASFHKMITDLMEAGAAVWPSVAAEWDKIKAGP